VVWEKAHKNALSAILLSKDCNSKYQSIVDQFIRAATSIGANIAEGNESGSDKQKESYFRIALNSSYELDNWLQILKDSEIVIDKGMVEVIEKENIEIIKILCKIIKSLKG
jgi:four helix bundle protein